MDIKCAICGKEIKGFFDRNNPEPILQGKGAIVCNKCNSEIIVPARQYLVWEGGLSSFLKLKSDEERLNYLREKGVIKE